MPGNGAEWVLAVVGAEGGDLKVKQELPWDISKTWLGHWGPGSERALDRSLETLSCPPPSAMTPPDQLTGPASWQVARLPPVNVESVHEDPA